MSSPLRSLLLLGAGLLLADGWAACAPPAQEPEPSPQPAQAPPAESPPESSTKPEASPPAAQATAPQASTAQAKPAAQPGDSGKKLSPEQLQSLVAPVALYPDELLAQTLVASTYPLEIIQLQQWLAKHKELKDEALKDSVSKQPWDPSIQSMAAMPDLVKHLSDDIQWTTDLGNAFLAQQSEVMDAVQVMRKKAQEKGALESNDKQKVASKQVEVKDSTDTTKVVDNKQVIVVESANPEVVYVPSYNPTVVYGPAYYPYPSIYYPVYTPGAAFVSFTFGMAWGAAMWGGACCHAGWGGRNVYVNNNNYYNRTNSFNRTNVAARNGTWQHNPQHRGGAPYGDRATANRYGGGTRAGGVGDRAAAGPAGQRGAGAGERNVGAGQAGGAGRTNVPGTTPPDRIGNQNIQRDAGSRAGASGASSASGLGGGSRGFDGAGARASSYRGGASMGGMRGGGGRRR